MQARETFFVKKDTQRANGTLCSLYTEIATLGAFFITEKSQLLSISSDFFNDSYTAFYSS